MFSNWSCAKDKLLLEGHLFLPFEAMGPLYTAQHAEIELCQLSCGQRIMYESLPAHPPVSAATSCRWRQPDVGNQIAAIINSSAFARMFTLFY